ncbi:putative two-component sensor kinase [Escherichia coli APEC IMT5155]|nr:LytS/YhcK type 5TM receptor domain-containing protein [Escherichia coli]AJB35534.1 putative two-component sensor kinase [Escherichia coli APEC IMT5155]
MLLAVFDRAALMLICLFFLIRIRLFRELLHKSAHSPKELLAVTAIFSLFALFSTWSGVPVEGSLVNVRIIAVMSGGILFGPWVGIITGVIAGIHRYLIDIGGVTAIPCFITSILAGCISGWINLKIPKAQRWRVGILGGMLCETLTMILVIVWAPTTALGIDIVSKIGIPMILGSVCIGFIVLLVQSVEGEKEASAARQAKLALDIANKTLPLFRHVNSESLRKVCEIIRDDIHADAVAMTNTDHVLAYVGVGEHNYQNGDDFISPTTRQAMNYGKIIIKNNDEAHRTPEIHSMLVIPLWEKGVVTISVAECGNRVRIAVRDTGHGIDPKVIERVEANEMPGNKIGLLNVHHRVKLLYGEGLHIRRLEPGTEIAFYIPNQRTPVASQATLLL